MQSTEVAGGVDGTKDEIGEWTNRFLGATGRTHLPEGQTPGKTGLGAGAARNKIGRGELPMLPRLPATAPGPSGERQEHLDDILKSCGPAVEERLMRALDQLTVRWAVGTLPDACRWLLDTQLLFLRKDTDTENKDFDDEQWTLEEHFWEKDIP